MTNALTIIPVKIKGEILLMLDEFKKKMKKLVIVDDKSLSTAVDIVKGVKEKFKELEDRRKELVKPLNDDVAIINTEFKNFTNQLTEIEKDLKIGIGNYNQKKEQERVEEQRKLDLAKQKEQEKLDKQFEKQKQKLKDKGVNTSVLVAPTVDDDAFKAKDTGKTFTTNSGASVTNKKVWTFRVVDLAKVPREFLVLDEKKVRDAIKADVRFVDGLEIFQDTITSIK